MEGWDNEHRHEGREDDKARATGFGTFLIERVMQGVHKEHRHRGGTLAGMSMHSPPPPLPSLLPPSPAQAACCPRPPWVPSPPP